MNVPRFEPKLTTIPELPKKFGDDGGNFYRYYDALADELDEDMVKSLKAQLDGILIFAGLFAGVNSAFLALTLPGLSATPADDTNALLLRFVFGPNGTIQGPEDLPSAKFAPAPGIFPVNVLFCLSLTVAIISAFLAVLGQQWLVYYRKRSGGGAEHQRWEQLRRYLGAKRWGLEAILDDVLPGLLQLALVIFCVGFVAYLRTLSKTMCYVIMGPMTIAVAVLLLMGIVGAWDRWCPFKSPLSHLLQGLGHLIKWHSIAARKLANNGKTVLANFPQKMAQRSPTFLPAWKEVWGPVIRSITRVWGPVVRSVNRVWGPVVRSVKEVLGPVVPSRSVKTVWGWVVRSVREVWGLVVHVANRALDRSGENIAHLEAIAAKRVLCTSEDFNALVYTAVNLHGMTSKDSIHYFLGDETVYERLKELWEGGRQSSGSPKVLAGAFSRAFLQLIFMGESAELLIEPRYRQQYSEALLGNHRDPTSLNLLMENVRILDECIDMGAEFLHTHWNDHIWLLYYCQILRVTLDENTCGSGLFEAWLSHVIDKYSMVDDCKPHIICLVAWGVRLLNKGIVTPTAGFTLRISDQEGEFEWERERERVRVRNRLEPARARLWREQGPAGLARGLARGLAGPGRVPGLVQRLEQGLEQGLEQRLEQRLVQVLVQVLELRVQVLELRVQMRHGERQGERPGERQGIDPVKAIKELVGSVGWEKPLVPKEESKYPQETVFGLIKDAFSTYASQSPRRRDHIDVWLLEQALVISTKTQYRDGWKFVVTSCSDLLCSLHEVEGTDAGRHSWHIPDDCLGSTRILSQCLQAIKEHSNSSEFRDTIESVLPRLEQYLPRFTTDFIASRCDNSVLLIWLEIRDRICEAIEAEASSIWLSRPIRDAYTRVKPYLDTIESALLKIKVASKADGNPADPAPIPAGDGQVGPSGSPGTEVPERLEENSGDHEPAHRKQEDASECRGDQNASATFAVDGPIEEGGGGGGDPRDDPVPRLVERENSIRRGTSDIQSSLNVCFPLRDQMLL